MALKEQDVVLYSTDTSGNKVIQMPITRVENVEGAVKTIDGIAPDANGNVTTPNKVTKTTITNALGGTPLTQQPSLNVNGRVTLSLGTWTATGNGMVAFWSDNGTTWGGGDMTVNGVAVGRHFGKESGATLYAPVKTGDVVVTSSNGGYVNGGIFFFPFN